MRYTLSSPSFLVATCSFLITVSLVIAGESQIPTQTFFIPLPEKDVFDITFKTIHFSAKGPVNSIIAISISTPNTIVWYDHHEDGYELGYRNVSALSSTTEIWGDGNCTNGYAFGTSCNAPSDDSLIPGQSIVIENFVDISAGANNGFKYDGGDKILANFPIAITRGAYPTVPGSLMAGAVEVLDTSEWGTFFVAPTGQDVFTPTMAFEHTALYIMAQEDGTTINFSDGTAYTLNCGESVTHIVKNMGETLTSSTPIQVDLLVGDETSGYELRWYALLPRETWTNSYLSPVGDTKGSNKVYLYNPSSSAINVTVQHANHTRITTERRCTQIGSFTNCRNVRVTVPAYPVPYTVTVPGLSYQFTEVVPTGTGAALSSSSTFVALSLTDTVNGGNWYDWGFPVLPTSKLTTKVLIGWGYGCTEKNCATTNDVGGLARSVVFVSPWEDADIYVDVDNDGVPEANKTVFGAMRLSSNIIENGPDLSGATIWAVKPGEAHDSKKSVPIAAAWGQNAGYSYKDQPLSLDLGTLVPPFIGVRVDEVVDLAVDKDGDGKISPGDEVEYTIQVQNAGPMDYGPCDYRIKDPGLPENLPRQKYVDGTCVFIYDDKEEPCDDASLNGGMGLCSTATLKKRGGVHLYRFRATVGSPAELDEVNISNQGTLTQEALGPILPFSAPEVVHFNPSINIEKTVHAGALTSCTNGLELLQGRPRDIITYCFQVTNTGNTYLDNVVVTDPDNGMEPITMIPFMAPGDVLFFQFETTMPSSPIATNATVTGEPRLVNRNVIPTLSGGNVTDLDDAGVDPIAYMPGVSIKKYVGTPGSNCNIESMNDDTYLAQDTKFEYCYVISNVGDECLLNGTVLDSSLGGIGTQSIPKLCPGNSSVMITGPTTTSTKDIPSTNASATATGEFSGSIVESNDPAAVDVPDFAPMLTIKKHAGPQGSSCSVDSMQDDTYLAEDTKFEYCYSINNVGNECLVNVVLTDSALGGIGVQSIPKICPGDDTVKIIGPTSTSKTDVLSTDATLTGAGEYSGLIVSSNDPAAVDIPDFAPMISIKKYAGPSGSSCTLDMMQDEIYLAENAQFEYCYMLTNTGNECVDNVVLSDSSVGGIGTQSIPKICQGDTAVLIQGPKTLSTTDVPSTDAAVTGIGEYSGLVVSAADPAGVDVPDFAPMLSIKKYAGPPGSSCTIEAMEDDMYLTEDTNFEYCYVISNTGNECVLNIVLTDSAVGGIGSQSIGKVCPVDDPVKIIGPPSSTTVGVPATDGKVSGTGEYSGRDVEVTDFAAIEYMEPPDLGTPGITIEKTVHVGDILTCLTGQELEYGFSGTVVTYCYEVTNVGDVDLNVVVTDEAVGTSESFPLSKGSSIFVKKVSSITADLTSPGVAVGTPKRGGGGNTVQDSDPAGVELVPVKSACS